MASQSFIGQGAIAIRDRGFWRTLPGRLERKLRHAFSIAGTPRRETRAALERIAVETPAGPHHLYSRPGTSDRDVIWSVFERRDYDLSRLRRFDEIRQWLGARHRQGRRPLIIDAGANIGASAVFFALTFPTATVIAIEPEPGNFELLVKNTHGLNVRCFHAALAATDGRAALHDPGEGNWGFRAERTEAGSGNLPCFGIDRLHRETCNGDVFPFLVKIDIEGGEADVFAANTSWVAETPVLIAELHDWLLPRQGTALPFLRCVSQLERDFVYLGEDVFSIAHQLPA